MRSKPAISTCQQQPALVLLLLLLLLGAAIFSPSIASATTIRHTLLFTRLTEFTNNPGIGQMKISAQGNRMVFSTLDKRVFTLRTDGTGLIEIFDYSTHRAGCPCIAPWVDIDADGTTVLWTDGAGEIFVAEADGSARRTVATSFRGPNIAVSGPSIRVPPRLSADGARIVFANSLPDGGRLANGWQDYAGIWSVAAAGGEPVQLVSYTRVSREILLRDGAEYNPNTAFFPALDINEDGSRVVFTTTQETGAIASLEGNGLVKLAPFAVTGPRALAMDTSGGRIAFIPQASGVERRVNTLDLGSRLQIPLADVGLNGGVQLGYPGEPVLALSSGSALPVLPGSLLTDNPPTRWDVIALFCYAPASANPFAAPALASMTSNARRIAFLSGGAIPQIWIADIDPSRTSPGPIITRITTTPSYVLANGTSTSTVTASVMPGTNPLERICLDPLFEGAATPGAFNGSELTDDGLNGDATAGDHVFSRGNLRRTFGPVGSYTLRINAFAGRHITSAEAGPFSIRNTAPVEPVSQIHTAVELRWLSERGVRYQPYRSLDAGTSFTPYGPVIEGTGDYLQLFDATRENPQAFFQIRLAD